MTGWQKSAKKIDNNKNTKVDKNPKNTENELIGKRERLRSFEIQEAEDREFGCGEFNMGILPRVLHKLFMGKPVTPEEIKKLTLLQRKILTAFIQKKFKRPPIR